MGGGHKSTNAQFPHAFYKGKRVIYGLGTIIYSGEDVVVDVHKSFQVIHQISFLVKYLPHSNNNTGTKIRRIVLMSL